MKRIAACVAAMALAGGIDGLAEEQLLAFPGAEGFGRYATGGRGGEVYHVTNLEDSGEGSFRDAVSQGNRIVVFDVSGVIRLKSAVTPASNITIAGQTAPGEGITLYGERLAFSNKENIICRYLRVRFGMNGADGKDAMGISDESHNMIFDHVSVTWGRDENFSINSTSAYDITIQNSIIGQGLQNHSCGGLIQTNTEHGITLYGNLYIDNKTRNPKVKGLNQFVNNVVYNWGEGAAYNMGGESAGNSLTTIENNYFIVGPVVNYQNVRVDDNTIDYGRLVEVSPARPFLGGNEEFSTYCVGNYYDKNKDGALNGIEITRENWEQEAKDNPTFLDARPEEMPAISNMMTAEETYYYVVKGVGASLPVRDEVDAYMIDELTSLGTKGTIIQDERNTTQFPIGGPGEIRKGKKLQDTDNDGMPDEWEKANGTNPEVDDAMEIAENGYANIENYINSIDGPQPFFAGPGLLRSISSLRSIRLMWTDKSDKETGFVLEQLDGEEWKEIATVAADETSYEVEGLEEGTKYTFRIKAVGEGEESEYSEILSTRTFFTPAVPNKVEAVKPENGSTLYTAKSEEYKFEWSYAEPNEDSGKSTFTLYVGESEEGMTAVEGAEGISVMYSYVAIESGKKYYWRVDATNPQGTTVGDTYTFETVELVEKEPIVYLPMNGDTKNYAPAAIALAKNGVSVDGEKDNVEGEYESGHDGKALGFPMVTEETKSAGVRVPYYEGMAIGGSASVSLWIKADGTFYGSAYIWHKGEWGTPIWIGAEVRGGTLYYVAKRGKNKQEIKVATGDRYTSIMDGNWHHLVFVRDQESQTMVFYLDGELTQTNAFSKTSDAVFNSETGITIGNSMDAGTNDEPFTGSIDEFKLYDSALTAGEVANLYATGTTSGKSAVTAVRSVRTAVGRDGVYDMAGRKVADEIGGLGRGVYVKDGKKVIVK